MAVSAKLYGTVIAKALNKEIDWDSDTIKVALCTSTYTPDQDNHHYFSDITNEVSGTGYTAGGATMTTSAVTYTGATNTTALPASNVSWTASTITARYAIIYDATPATNATRPLIGYVDFGADVISTGGTFQITWDPSGVATFTVS